MCAHSRTERVACLSHSSLPVRFRGENALPVGLNPNGQRCLIQYGGTDLQNLIERIERGITFGRVKMDLIYNVVWSTAKPIKR